MGVLCDGVRELETAIREKSAGNLPGDGSLELRYQDGHGDVLALHPDGQWSTFVARARGVIIICN